MNTGPHAQECTARTLVELHRRQAERLGPRPALRYRKNGLYYDVTWSDYHEASLACAAGLIAAGIGVGDRVGLLSENRVEWLIADMGILAAGAVNVPLHAPLSAAQIQYQLADSGVRWIFVSTTGQLQKVQSIQNDLPQLQQIVAFDPTTESDVLSWQGFLQTGRSQLKELDAELRQREALLGPDSLATIMYTSGTTGTPKGVMLTQENLLSNAAAVDEAFPRGPDAILLSWLPYSHIYARTVDHYLSLVSTPTLCLADSAETVVEDLTEILPTHMASVPRFYEKLLSAVASSDLDETGRRLRKIFGRRIDWLTSGGAPLPLPVAQAFKSAGLLVLQGYGLTECAPVITFNSPSAYKLESVGKAIPGVEVAIAEDGEILTRGPHVMPGYWKDEKATAEAVRDGWLYTGDLGNLDADGFLTITGRKKDLLVLSNGKKVVPAYLEGLLLTEPCIDQVVVYGEGRNYLTALIVPHWENTCNALAEKRVALGTNDVEELAKDGAVLTLFSRRLKNALADVSTWEQIHKFHIVTRPFSIETEELTVSLKIRRKVIFENYKAELEQLYNEQ